MGIIYGIIDDLGMILNQRAGCWGRGVDRVDRCTGLGRTRLGINFEDLLLNIHDLQRLI